MSLIVPVNFGEEAAELAEVMPMATAATNGAAASAARRIFKNLTSSWVVVEVSL